MGVARAVPFSVSTHLAIHKLVYFTLSKLQSQNVSFKENGHYVYL